MSNVLGNEPTPKLILRVDSLFVFDDVSIVHMVLTEVYSLLVFHEVFQQKEAKLPEFFLLLTFLIVRILLY